MLLSFIDLIELLSLVTLPRGVNSKFSGNHFLPSHTYSAHFQYESVGIKKYARHSSAATLCDICTDKYLVNGQPLLNYQNTAPVQ